MDGWNYFSTKRLQPNARRPGRSRIFSPQASRAAALASRDQHRTQSVRAGRSSVQGNRLSAPCVDSLGHRNVGWRGQVWGAPAQKDSKPYPAEGCGGREGSLGRSAGQERTSPSVLNAREPVYRVHFPRHTPAARAGDGLRRFALKSQFTKDLAQELRTELGWQPVCSNKHDRAENTAHETRTYGTDRLLQ